MNTHTTKYTHRHLARVILETRTPLAIGSGEKDIITDALVATDANGLPYIPGTTIGGVLRSMMGGEETNETFGFQSKTETRGSNIIFSEAKILDSRGRVMDGQQDAPFADTLLAHYQDLPVRQHVRIGHQGAAEKHGKFDEQIVFAGTRFCFEIEMVAEDDLVLALETTLENLFRHTFRLGSGSRSGFGEVEIISLQRRVLDLRNDDDRTLYLQKSSALDAAWKGWEDADTPATAPTEEGWCTYEIILRPDDFFLFSSGEGDDEADMTPVTESVVQWTEEGGAQCGKMSEQQVLIPASSVKGALSHRLAFHYNRLKEQFADHANGMVGKNNEAIRTLFGAEDPNDIQRGRVLMSDVFAQPLESKLMNHVSIDRFTGGAIDGALFSEKAFFGQGEEYVLRLLVEEEALTDPEIQTAWECTLRDLTTGMLPLGGGVNRGHGVFTGTITKNGETL